MISSIIIGRFREAVELHAAIHALKFRTNTKDATVSMVVQVATAILEAQMYDMLNAGISELYYSTNSKISPMAKVYMDKNANNNEVSVVQRNDTKEGTNTIQESNIPQELSSGMQEDLHE